MKIEELYKIYLSHPVVTTDTRQCEAGSIFFALKGENFNGNKFASVALEAGCSYVVIDESEYAVSGDERYLLVDDVLATLQQLAAYHRQQLTIPVLQITGTNGKTTTKELVSAVLSKKYNTLFTQGNLNNHIGVPRTLLRIRPEHDIAVIETGANHPGEIAFLCKMVQADYGLITNVGRAHLEGFGSFEGVKATKGELYDDLSERGKAIFLNCFDDDLLEMAAQRGGVPFSENPRLEVQPYVEGRVSDCNRFLQIQWREDDWSPWHTVQTNLIGAYNIANLRAAITVGLFFDVDAADIDVALTEYKPTNSRSEFRDTGKNQLIVDAYNANPSSMAVALDNFQFVEAERKMVILGDMRELGADSDAEHQKVVEKVISTQVSEAWFVGSNFAAVPADKFGVLKYRLFPTVEEVKAAIQSEPLVGRTILIKGSNGTKLFQLPELL